MLFIFMLCLCLFHFFNLHHAQCFNLFVFPNYMLTSLLLFFFYEGFFIFFMKGRYELSGEIALKNNHYYYTVLQWFSSHLTDRTHYVSLSNHCSAFTPVHSCVPQGSVLGPILFTMYIKHLSAIIDSHSIIHHSFADDLQLQMSAATDIISELLHSMQSCICDVKAWATANMLKLNDNKTELMLITSKRTKHLHSLPTSITIFPSKSL